MIGKTITALVESLEKPGMLGAIGMKLERVCTRELASYFRLMATTLPIQELGAYAAQGNKAAALHAAEMKIRRVMRGLQPLLLEILSTNMMLAYKTGWQNLHLEKGVKIKEASTTSIKGSPLDKLGPTGERAADYAATNAGALIKGLNQTTLDLLQEAISTGIEEMLGVDGTARLIRNTVMDMSVERAKTIATTEMNDAMSTAALEKLNNLGVDYKRWIAEEDACDDCQGNADEGAIPVDDSFSSGDDAPSAHPKCRCALVGARAPEGDD